MYVYIYIQLSDMIHTVADSSSPVAFLVPLCSFPPGWDSVPIAFNLLRAKRFNNCTLFEENQMRKNLHNSSLTLPTQNMFTRSLIECAGDDWLALLERRLHILLPGVRVIVQQASFNLFSSIRALPLSSKIMVIRTVLNSWSTSHRYHEEYLLHCIFGCNLQCPLQEGVQYWDTLTHYIQCPMLWKIVNECYPLPEPRPHPLQLICLRFADSDPLPIIIAHHVYHSIRHGRGTALQQVRSLQDLRTIHNQATNHGKAIVADLR